MGHVNVQILGILFNDLENRNIMLTIDKEMNLKQLINSLLKDFFKDDPDLDLYRNSDWEDYLLVLVNGRFSKPNTILKDGDKITIIPMLSSG